MDHASLPNPPHPPSRYGKGGAYDFILAGGGAAGLSLACAMTASPLADRSILVIDRDTKQKNDRTWCFWQEHDDPLDGILYREWDAVRFTGPGFDRRIELGNFNYKMIRGIDYYEHTRRLLAANPNVYFLQGQIEHIEDGPQSATVVVDGQTFTAGWVFDSRVLPGSISIDHTRYHDLKQHFLGWTIQTDWNAPFAAAIGGKPVFDPATPTLFDFRVESKLERPLRGSDRGNDMRFFYILPFSETEALVEFTLFSTTLLSREEYRAGLEHYLEHTLGVGPYRIVEEESGVIPMTDRPFPRRLGQRIMAIGTLGGRVKPSTGYAFARIQKDSAAIVASLLHGGHPFGVKASPRRYTWFDRTMLHVMQHHGAQMDSIFTQMFRNNPIQRIFRFMDEENSLLEDLRVLVSVPIWPFVKAFFWVNVLGRV